MERLPFELMGTTLGCRSMCRPMENFSETVNAPAGAATGALLHGGADFRCKFNKVAPTASHAPAAVQDWAVPRLDTKKAAGLAGDRDHLQSQQTPPESDYKTQQYHTFPSLHVHTWLTDNPDRPSSVLTV